MQNTELEDGIAPDDDAPEIPHEVWGFYEDGTFIPLPIVPMAHLGPPPFDVELPNGRVRHVVRAPTEQAA